tara:strand:- start:112 stop:297 length:186 start_codon:yes stop_codon:yes gene_type:complete
MHRIFDVSSKYKFKNNIMKQSKILNRIQGLQISLALNTELGNVTRAEMNRSAIEKLTLLIK